MTDNEQKENLKRVRVNLAPAIIAFCGCNRFFHADDLRRYVGLVTNSPHAPGSSDRILRLLREKGEINYRVIDRAKSLYEVIPVVPPTTDQPELPL